MEYILALILIIGFIVANHYLWGDGPFKGAKEIACVVAGAAVGGAVFLKTGNYYVAGIYTLVGGLLFWFYRLWPISYYFRVFNPTLASTDTGIAWINKIAGTNWWLAVSLRGLYAVPLVASFAYLNLWAIPLSALTFSMGTIYWLQKFQPKTWWTAQWQLPVAEFLFGATLGGLLALSL